MSRGFLLDTNVVSEIRKGARANARVRAWYDAADAASLWLSVLSLGEIRRGVELVRKRDAAGAASLDRWLARLVRDHKGRVLPISGVVADAWGSLDARLGPLPVVDGLLAATAIVHELIVVTRNTDDFFRTGADVHDPWA